MDRSHALAFRRNGHGLDKLQASKTGSFILQLLVAELAQAVVLPPLALLLAPVEVEDVGEEPSRLLLGRSVLRVGRIAATRGQTPPLAGRRQPPPVEWRARSRRTFPGP